MNTAFSWRGLALTATLAGLLVLVVNPSADLTPYIGGGTPIVVGPHRDAALAAEVTEKLGSPKAEPTPASSIPDPASVNALPRTGPEVPVLIGAAAFLLIIGFLMFWTGGFGGKR